MKEQLYNLFVRLYGTGIRVATLFSPKARLWISGRNNLISQLPPRERLKGGVWFHTASLGEFEQALPVIEALHEREPETPILVSFFSPSGYEQRKKFPLATAVFYLPLDLPSRIAPLLDHLQPKAIWVVKYEFWYHFFKEAGRRNIPLYLLSAVFRPDQPFFKSWGSLHREMLRYVTRAFVQDEMSLKQIQPLLGEKAVLTGDTRFDRVNKLAEKALPVDELKAWNTGKPILILGSAWEPEMKLTEAALTGDSYWNLLVVPHEVSEAYLQQAQQLFSIPLQRWQQYLDQPAAGKALLMDRVGLLGRLYRHAAVAFVGGAFGKGLHNILEPAAFGVPVIFGPAHQRFPEAKALLNAGGGFSITTAQELKQLLAQLQDTAFREQASMAARNWVQQNRGATARVFSHLGS